MEYWFIRTRSKRSKNDFPNLIMKVKVIESSNKLESNLRIASFPQFEDKFKKFKDNNLKSISSTIIYTQDAYVGWSLLWWIT